MLCQVLHPDRWLSRLLMKRWFPLWESETTEIALKPGAEITVIMMAGLQGAGKTTTTAKLAGKFKEKGKKPLLVACDVYTDQQPLNSLLLMVINRALKYSLWELTEAC